MKILHVNSYYCISSFYKNFYEAQIQSGNNIEVFVPVSYSFNNDISHLGDYTIVSKNHNKYDRYLFSYKHYKIYKDLLHKVNMTQIRMTHAHSLFSNGVITWKVKQEFKIPYVVAVRNTDVNQFFKKAPHLRKIGIKIMQDAKNIIFLSETYRDHVIEKYVPSSLKSAILEKASIIQNGIDDFWFNNICVNKRTPKQRGIKLLYVGTVDKNKNITATISAIEILQKKGYIINFTIVGKIVDKSLYERIKKLPFVKYIPPKGKEGLLEIYKCCDLFVMPSITETFGLVYLEAMSQGLPVIYSKGQGFDRQFEEGQVGYHVNSTSPDDIASKIEKILSNYSSISATCIREVQKFKWSTIVAKYNMIYELD